MTEKTMEEKVAAVLSSKAPATLKTLAAATGLTELEASKLLPADSRAYADGSKFDAVWSSACAWPSATFFLEHLGNVIEVSCKLAEGKHGYSLQLFLFHPTIHYCIPVKIFRSVLEILI